MNNGKKVRRGIYHFPSRSKEVRSCRDRPRGACARYPSTHQSRPCLSGQMVKRVASAGRHKKTRYYTHNTKLRRNVVGFPRPPSRVDPTLFEFVPPEPNTPLARTKLGLLQAGRKQPELSLTGKGEEEEFLRPHKRIV